MVFLLRKSTRTHKIYRSSSVLENKNQNKTEKLQIVNNINKSKEIIDIYYGCDIFKLVGQ